MIDIATLAAGLTAASTYAGTALTDAAGRLVRFEPLQVPGRGWTVARITGSARTGRSIERIDGYVDSYTMQQASLAAQAALEDQRGGGLSHPPGRA